VHCIQNKDFSPLIKVKTFTFSATISLMLSERTAWCCFIVDIGFIGREAFPRRLVLHRAFLTKDGHRVDLKWITISIGPDPLFPHCFAKSLVLMHRPVSVRVVRVTHPHTVHALRRCPVIVHLKGTGRDDGTPKKFEMQSTHLVHKPGTMRTLIFIGQNQVILASIAKT
jgi:hypothetical protein